MTIKLTTSSNKAYLIFDKTLKNGQSLVIDDILTTLEKNKIKNIYAEVTSKNVSSLMVAEIFKWYNELKQHNIIMDFSELDDNLQNLLNLLFKQPNIPPKGEKNRLQFLEIIGIKTYQIYKKVIEALKFIHSCFISLGHFISGRAIYRRKDFWFIFEDCSYKAVGITALVSFLVGLILAFVGALQLRTFGAGIYVASMVTLGMTRIMAAIMVGIIMAGRTGSSYAATLGTMQVNEEIDALKTLGIQITDYLVAPRMVSLIITIPFLTLLADLLGVFGGAIVGVSFLGISAPAYFDYSIKALNLTNVLVGLLHSLVYGVIIAMCGCYEGLTAGRDADAVGKATTSSVVTALVWMIVATGILTVLMEVIGV